MIFLSKIINNNARLEKHERIIIIYWFDLSIEKHFFFTYSLILVRFKVLNKIIKKIE